ncbi:hypothetical protein [Zhouia amylolytica]|uniref:hypothetical protein n=1 Tax=Zhouia amylolytica TaxID=376730 RepID=UPI0020CD395C|nr:hypothetical protein [Zhouia amylolytica]MCQ0112470.1 hypothetical protein [Zhouia amylolytica]
MGFEFFAVKFLEKSDSYSENISLLNLKDFNGKYYIYDSQANKILAKMYSNGTLVGEVNEVDKTKNVKQKMEEECVIVTTQHYTEIYALRDGEPELLYVVYEGYTEEEVCVDPNNGYDPYEGATTGGNDTGVGSTSPEEECPDTVHGCYYEFKEEVVECPEGYSVDENGNCVEMDDDITIDPSVPECLEEIINDLKTKSKNIYIVPGLPLNTNLSSIILNLFESSSNHNLEIKIGNLSSSKNAVTVPTSLGNGEFKYTITLNQLFLQNATDLAVARTIIHESLHAHLSHMYQDQPFTDFSSRIRYHLAQNGYNTNDAQHEMFVEFTEAMAYSLQEWDNNSIGSYDYYYYLSWSGDMLQTNDFEHFPEAFKKAITDANIAEGQANAASTTNAKGSNNCR